MHGNIEVAPPTNLSAFKPSELFRYFFQIGHWTEESFISDFQNYTRGKLISTVTVNKWKNKNVIPTRYAGHLFKMIEANFDRIIAKKWIIAFETVWATHAAHPVSEPRDSGRSSLADKICLQHGNWIKAKFEEPHLGETFSKSDIYVPLQLIETKQDVPEVFDVEDLITQITQEQTSSKTTEWTLISGTSGSGKSMAALHLACTLFAQTKICPIYFRGSHLSDIELDLKIADHPIGDSFSIRSFLKNFRSSSYSAACLIIDGLDEIQTSKHQSSKTINSLISELSLEQETCRSYGKTLNIILFGRQFQCDYAANLIRPKTFKTFEILALDGHHRNKKSASSEITGRDMRRIWWEKHLLACGRNSDLTLPDFLCVEYANFSDFGSEPLLSYLLCKIALEVRKHGRFRFTRP